MATDAPGDDVHIGLPGLLPDLRAFARFLARDRTHADDLVQESIARALAARSQFASGTDLKAWMFTILRRTFYEQARRARREASAMRVEALRTQADTPWQVGRADIADVERLLWTLPPLLREALVLVGAQQMSHEEAAGICGVPVGTMKARVSRARSALSRAVADTPHNPED